MRKLINISRLFILLAALLFTTLAQAQIEVGKWINYRYSFIKTYSPVPKSIQIDQLVSNLNKDIQDIVEVNYSNDNEEGSVVVTLKDALATDSKISDSKHSFEDLYYQSIRTDEKIKLWYGRWRFCPNGVWGVDLKINGYKHENKQFSGISFQFVSQESAQDFAETIYYILHPDSYNAERLEEIKADSVLFIELATKYRELKVKPVITEEQRKFIVQANSKSEKKEYKEALGFYQKAIQVNPTSYPSAYNNMALLAAQLKDYNLAILNMKKYLMLVPETEDARAAQDKIYEWEAEIGK